MTEEEFQQLIARHGGQIGTKILDPKIKVLEPNYGDLTGKQIEVDNPNPHYRYSLADGTHFTARRVRDAAGTPAGYEITDAGTAVKTPTTKLPTPTTLGPQHAGEPVTDPETGAVMGFYDQAGRFVPTARAARAPASEAPGVASERAARAGLYSAQTAEIQQKMLPAQQLLIQNHFKTIDALQQMLAQGQLTPDEASAYLQDTKQSLDAALQGTTPFQQQEAQLRHLTEQQQLGKDLLDQRLQSGRSLASSLLTSAASLASKAMLEPGQSFGISPMKLAMAFTNELGGGEAVSGLAKALLTGATPGQGPTGYQPAGSPGMAAPSPSPAFARPTDGGPVIGDRPLSRDDALRMFPELAGTPLEGGTNAA